MPLSIYLSLSTFSLSFSLSLFSRLLRGETISHGGRALSAACAKCGRNSNPLVPFVLPARGRSTSYNQPAIACRAAKREKRQHPTGNCIDARCTSKSISSLNFRAMNELFASLRTNRFLVSTSEISNRERIVSCDKTRFLRSVNVNNPSYIYIIVLKDICMFFHIVKFHIGYLILSIILYTKQTKAMW